MAISSGVTVRVLSAEETRATGYTHACTIPYSTVSTVGGAATTATVAILDAAVGDVVCEAALVNETAWTDSDASLNSVVVEVGDDGDVDRFMGQKEVLEEGTEVDYFAALAGVAATPTCPFAYATANTVDAKFTVAGGGDPTCAELTAGQLTILLRVYSLAKLVGATAGT